MRGPLQLFQTWKYKLIEVSFTFLRPLAGHLFRLQAPTAMVLHLPGVKRSSANAGLNMQSYSYYK